MNTDTQDLSLAERLLIAVLASAASTAALFALIIAPVALAV